MLSPIPVDTGNHTSREELLLSYLDLDGRLLALGIAVARGQKTPRDQLIHPPLVRFEVDSGSSGMDWRMGFIIFAPVSRSLKLAIDQSSVQLLGTAGYSSSPRREAAPVPVNGLLLEERHEVKGLVVLVRLGTRV